MIETTKMKKSKEFQGLRRYELSSAIKPNAIIFIMASKANITTNAKSI